MFITPPNPKDDVRVLWKKVAECVNVINALMNMTVYIEGEERILGKLEMRDGSCYLRIHSNTEVGSLGT